MKILFDHNVDRRLRNHLPLHTIQTAREMGWDKLANGRLLRACADAGFDVFLSVDKKLEHEQNLSTLPLPVVILDSVSTALPNLLPLVPTLLKLLDVQIGRALHIVRPDGQITELKTPRS